MLHLLILLEKSNELALDYISVNQLKKKKKFDLCDVFELWETIDIQVCLELSWWNE